MYFFGRGGEAVTASPSVLFLDHGVFMAVPSVLLVCSFLSLVVFFAQFYPSSAIEQKGKTEKKKHN
jgi:hypothetical protein